MTVKTEQLTRRDLINPLLEKAGWSLKDRTKVVEEVDTKQSDFRRRDYKTIDETLKNDAESAYMDYLLLDSTGLPLAIVEAKRTTRDPILGQKQAELYYEDIKKQMAKDVFIFLTNGFEIWFWNKPHQGLRPVKGFHSREALERIRFQNEFKEDLGGVPVKKEIVDRAYQIEAVKRVLEGLRRGKRKFLIVQATGSGKTRVAMALIDVLLRTKHAQKVLFLADRKALRDQAYSDGFKVFFPQESKTKVFSGQVDKTARLFVSTIQTFMECYEDFSIGDFDVIISDECHRSIYHKWKDVFTYFDAIEVGLTATPAEMIERDTFRFFDCENRIPTTLYTFDEAVTDRVLVPYKVYKTKTRFQIKGIRPEDVPAEVMRKLAEKGTDPEEVNFEGTDIEKKVIVIGTNEAIVKEFMENCITDETGTFPAKSIIFAITKQHAKRLWEAFEKLFPEYKGNLARIIVSEDPRAQQSLKEFKTESMPRVAISVDMLDTGVDIPEACNLVFAKPVFSKIRFWQMIGRGTRNDATCTHKDWLPNGKKEEFLIFDCWVPSVFDWFDMHPEGKEAKPSEAVPAKIFLVRLRQLQHFQTKGDVENTEKVKQKLIEDIKALPEQSIAVREHSREVELALSPKLWDRVGLDPVQFLKTKMAPLMRYKAGVEPNEASFTQKCEQLSLAILAGNQPEIDRLREDVGEMLNCLPTTIQAVSEKQGLLDRALTQSFWRNPSYQDAQALMTEFGPVMKYRTPEPRPKIELDIDDIMESREMIEYGPFTAPKADYVKDYRQKVEDAIKKLAETHPTIMKIKRDEILTEQDLQNLESTLNSPELYVTEEVLQKLYKQHKGTLVQLIKKVLGLYEFPEPEKMIEEAFKTFMIEKNYLNADQLSFLRAIESVFAKKHHIEYSDLFEPPFTNWGPNAPVPLLRKEDVDEVLSICNGLEGEMFTNA
jgi:type I restriction enzyme R subunit